MDYSSLFAGLLFGIPLGVGATYLFTHKEMRTALFARLHTAVDDVHQKISAAMAKKTPPPPPAS